MIPASTDHITGARHQLRDWLASIDVDPRRESDVLLAIGETVTNAIEHGCGSDPDKTVYLEAFVRDDTITDPGQWLRDSSASGRAQYRGRGLTMINGMTDHVPTPTAAPPAPASP